MLDLSWTHTVQKVVAIKSLRAVAKQGHDTVDGNDFAYDMRLVRGGFNAACEVLPFRRQGYRTAVSPRWLGTDAFLLPYSGFARTFRDENFSGDAARDDQLYYRGTVRGVDLLTYGNTTGEALETMRHTIRTSHLVKMLLGLRR